MLMSSSVPSHFCFLLRSTDACCCFPCMFGCASRQIDHKIFIWIAPCLPLTCCFFFNFTGRQGVCVVPVETPASGKSRLDPGCQLGGWAVSGFFSIFFFFPSNCYLKGSAAENSFISRGEGKYVWKSLKGCLRHLGHSARVTTESGADADLSRLIPGLAV